MPFRYVHPRQNEKNKYIGYIIIDLDFFNSLINNIQKISRVMVTN